MGILGELLTPQPKTNSGKFLYGRNKKKKNGIDSLVKLLLFRKTSRTDQRSCQIHTWNPCSSQDEQPPSEQLEEGPAGDSDEAMMKND